VVKSFVELLKYLKLTDLNLYNYESLLAANNKLPKGFVVKKLNNGAILSKKIDDTHTSTVYHLTYPITEERIEEILNEMV
jgi:hypothetical protein